MPDNEYVFEIDAQTFQTDVVQRSNDAPVVLYFWTEQIAPSVSMKDVMTSLANRYQGKFFLGVSDVAQDPVIAQQLRVQNIPCIRVIKEGKIAESIDGPQGERVITEMLDKLTMTSSEALQSDLQSVIAAGDWDSAIEILREALSNEPSNPAFKVEWADVLALKGDFEGCEKVLATIDESEPSRVRPETRLAFAKEAVSYPTEAELRATLASNPDDLETQYQLTIVLISIRQYEEGIDLGLAIMQRDRQFRDGDARENLIKAANLLEKGSPIAKTFRRRLYSMMY